MAKLGFKIFLFVIASLFYTSLPGMCHDDKKPYPLDHSDSSDRSQTTGPNFWQIQDIADDATFYLVREFFVKAYLQKIQELLNADTATFEVLFKKCMGCKIDPNVEKQCQLFKEYKIFLQDNGEIKAAWLKCLVYHSLDSMKEKSIFSFKELVARKKILPRQDEEHLQEKTVSGFWRVGGKTFTAETINYVCQTLFQINLPAVNSEDSTDFLIKWLKIWCESINKSTLDSLIHTFMKQVLAGAKTSLAIQEVSKQFETLNIQAGKAQKILTQTKFIKSDGTLNIWARIIIPKVIYQIGTNLFTYSFKQLGEHNIITPLEHPSPHQQDTNNLLFIDDEEDIISSQSISKMGGDDEK